MGSSRVPNFHKSGGLAGSQFLEVFAGKEGGDFFLGGVAVFTLKIN